MSDKIRMEFSEWVQNQSKGKLNETTIDKLKQEDLDDLDALKTATEDELKCLNLTIGQSVVLRTAVAALKRDGTMPVFYGLFDSSGQESSFLKWAPTNKLKEKTIQTLKEQDLHDLFTLHITPEDDLNALSLTIGQRALVRKAVRSLRDSMYKANVGMQLIDMTKKTEFTRLQERQLRAVPNALRIIHGKLWVCFDDGIAIHDGEIKMLEEAQYLQLNTDDDMQVTKIEDVAELPRNKVAVAGGSGLFVFTAIGEFESDVYTLRGTRHSSVAFHDNKLFAVTNSSVFPQGAVCVYQQQNNSWKRIRVIYLPSSCSYDHNLTLGMSENNMYVCNYISNSTYMFTIEGESLNNDKECINAYLCASDDTAVLLGRWCQSMLVMLDRNGKLYENVVPILNRQLKGAVVYERKLYVACYGKRVGYLQMYDMQ